MKFLTIIFLFLCCSCKYSNMNSYIIPIQRLQITPEPICRTEYAIDLVECLGFYKKALQKSNNNIEKFLEIYNQNKN